MTATRTPDFAAFPRARLTLKWHRRQVLTSLATELRVRADRSVGGSTVKVPDLGTLPDEILELMTPRLTPGHLVEEWDPPFARAVGLIDGRLTLRQIADVLAREFRWDHGYALRYARGVFLYLASQGLALPVR